MRDPLASGVKLDEAVDMPRHPSPHLAAIPWELGPLTKLSRFMSIRR